jgi:hypothetical protein
MKFEFPPKTNIVKDDEKKDEKTILSQIRSSSLGHKIIKGALTASLFMGLENKMHAKDNIVNKEKIENDSKIKLRENNPKPEEYDAGKIIGINKLEENVDFYKNNPEDFIKNGIINSQKEYIDFSINYGLDMQSKRRLEIKELEELIKKDSSISDSIQSIINDRKESLSNWVKYQKNKEEEKIKYLSNQEENSPLTEEEKKVIDNSKYLVNTFESTKDLLINLVNTESYLKKLQTEFNCSLEEAKQHQSTRISNIKITNCNFMSTKMLESVINCQAGYMAKDHIVYVPYDVDQKKLVNLSLHELLHAMTLGNSGISNKAKDLLEISFNGKMAINNEESDYHKNATERYVRLKILDMELDRLGIKKFGESISKDQYDKMLKNSLSKMESKNSDNYKFINKNAEEFIDFNIMDDNEGGYELYKKLFDEIASNNKTYKHSDWNYQSPNDLA